MDIATFSTQSVDINSKMPKVTLKKIKEHFNGNMKGKNILLMGATTDKTLEM